MSLLQGNWRFHDIEDSLSLTRAAAFYFYDYCKSYPVEAKWSSQLRPRSETFFSRLKSFPDMDVAECEQRRFEFIDDLTDLEKQFAILREQ